MIKIIKQGLLLCTLLGSLQTEAKIETYQQSYSGNLSMNNMVDADYYVDATSFSDAENTLSLSYEALKMWSDPENPLYVVFGTYTRSGGHPTMLGNFDFSLNLYDPTGFVDLYSDTLPIIGTFNLQDIRDLPDGASELLYGETGILTGYLSKNDYVSFKIDWIVYTADSVSAVPAPPALWMFVIGLSLIGGMRLFKRSK
jgi:hypothetical protein